MSQFYNLVGCQMLTSIDMLTLDNQQTVLQHDGWEKG
jgi:hypothetical protein